MLLRRKNILLMVPRFFNCSDLIIDELKKQGATVYFVENKLHKLDYSSPSAKGRWIRKAYHKISNVKWKYANQTINWEVKYDLFIAFNGFSYDKKIIDKLKQLNPNIRTILYLWDSTKMFNWTGIEKDFDKSLTFDPIDAKNLGIEYLTNFYPETVECCQEKPLLDLFFVGTQHADRYNVVKSIYDDIKNPTNSYIKLLVKYKNVLHNKFLYLMLRNIKSNFAKNYTLNYELLEHKITDEFLMYNPITPFEIEDKMRKTRCVLDIQSPNQVGLSHQMLKALAMGKKIITTNSWMVNYNFYNPEQILIIDRDAPFIDKEFLLKDYSCKTINQSIINSRIDIWIKILLS